MISLAELVDRVTGVHALRDKAFQQEKMLDYLLRLVLEHQRDISELKGTLKALVKIHSSQSH